MTKSTPTPPRSAPSWRRFLPPLLAFALVAVLGTLLLKPASQTGTQGPLLGQAAPAFTLQSLDGQQVSLNRFKGKPVVLNFWASWCGPCRQEAPLFRDLQARHGSEVALIGVLFQETSEGNARKFIQEFKLTYPNLSDPNSDTGIKYGVAGIPVTVFIDKAGVVRHLDRGGLTPEKLNAGLEKIGVPGL